jgi:hypothetical protein
MIKLVQTIDHWLESMKLGVYKLWKYSEKSKHPIFTWEMLCPRAHPVGMLVQLGYFLILGATSVTKSQKEIV